MDLILKKVSIDNWTETRDHCCRGRKNRFVISGKEAIVWMCAIREVCGPNLSICHRSECNFDVLPTLGFPQPFQNVQSEDGRPNDGLTLKIFHRGQVLLKDYQFGYSRRCYRDLESPPKSNAVSLRFFNLTACFSSAGSKLFLYDISGHEVAGCCRVESDLYFTPEPVVVFISFLLPANYLPHIIAQHLCSGAVEGLHHRNKIAFQIRVNPKSKGCLSHVIHTVLHDKYIVAQADGNLPGGLCYGISQGRDHAYCKDFEKQP